MMTNDKNTEIAEVNNQPGGAGVGSPTITMKEMCETIEQTKILKKKDGTNPIAKEIFEYSSKGELFMIWGWYEIAKVANLRQTIKERT